MKLGLPARARSNARSASSNFPSRKKPDRAERRLHLRAIRVERERTRVMLPREGCGSQRILDAVHREHDLAVGETAVCGSKSGASRAPAANSAPALRSESGLRCAQK